MVVLLTERDSLAPPTLVLIVVVKLAALVIAAAAGFRGGRIFPGIFIGVAIGVLANALFPAVPVSLAVAAGVLGVILVIAKDGWLALFLAAAVSGDIATLPMLCIIVLPTWLLARSVPEMIVRPAETDEPATR
jgi:H+/Cl- antiporter ClcA